jgi:uncharacterized membrane protein
MKKILVLGSLVLALTSTVSINAQAQEKKGISQQGKGAIIGGAGGAVAGALIGHNVGGAVIGGAIGAGGGYIIGNEAANAQRKRNMQDGWNAAAHGNGHTRVRHTHIKKY